MLIVQNAAEPARLRNALVDMVAAGAIDIRAASAYVTLGGANILLSAVANAVGPAAFAAMPKTLVTSFDFGLTEPQALQHWRGLANATVLVSGAQRLAQGSLMPQCAFHPKLYVFGTDLQTCSTLVGSANLTSRGFSVNTEAAWAQQGVARRKPTTYVVRPSRQTSSGLQTREIFQSAKGGGTGSGGRMKFAVIDGKEGTIGMMD